MKQFCALVSLTVLVGSAACTSNCDNAGVSVDGQGNIVVRGENGFISPNSSILRNIGEWPQPPSGEQNFAFSQGYTLTRDGAMYVLENTAQHPNLVYSINLANGRAAPIGTKTNRQEAFGSNAESNETWIAADDRYAYSADQVDAAIRRADLSNERPTLTAFIHGPKTQLQSPIAVAADAGGRLCALDSQTHFLLCYEPHASGDVAPARAIDLKKLLGYAEVGDLVFDRSGRIVVSGTSDSSGIQGSSVAVIDVATHLPQVVRNIAGPNTRLLSPQLAVDELGNILVLQRDSLSFRSGSELLAFGPEQRGDVAPRWVRDPAASVTHPFRIAVGKRTGDVAILGSDGVALFPQAARRSSNEWPAEVRLPMRGWSIAFSGASLIVADEFGGLEKHGAQRLRNEFGSGGSSRLDLRDPQFISTDQKGRVYVASTDGVITAFPRNADASAGWKTTTFATTFGRNMNAFAVDSAGYFYLSSASNDAILTIDAKSHQSIISGASTKLNRPLGLAVNRDGSLFVANTSAKSILIFSRGSSGNVAPAAEIAGPATELVAPQALAIDAGGRLYVFDGPQTTSELGVQHYVRVYDSAARGNVAALQSYPVQTKCWANAL